MVFVNQSVKTPYGNGKVTSILSNQVIVQPTEWQLANNQKPIFYMNPKDVKPYYNIDDEVQCSFGLGKVVSIRDSDGIYVVTLNSWKLANNKSPTLYLNEASLSKPKSKTAASKVTFASVYSTALTIKDAAKDLYVAKKFYEAKIKYTEAIQVLRTVEEELTNEEKGKFFEMSVTCNSNLALCASGLNEFSECILFSRNTVNLVEALERQGFDNVVWKALQDTGVGVEKLKEWKLKVVRLIAKSEIKRKNYVEAKTALENAITLTSNDKFLKELNELLADTQKKLAQEKKKEKSMWQNAFKKRSEQKEEDEPPTAQSSSSPTSPMGNSNGGSFSPKAGATNGNDSDEKLKYFDSEMAKFQTNKKVEKKTAQPKPAEESRVWKPDDLFASKYFNTFLFMGTVGVLGTLAFWWSKRHSRL